ncbi:hypothetical protein [Paraburkholderia dinghuensis]|uniref:DUF2971 domain-containing protein n=1 Tax=Paraburkholderia dinghuensis TaxID=2305225 RepID=A0A3N6N1V7_9BURK|nr:hypothetical protein [Paraburkholderia dinghuensis]RQH08445.1 hypothetical protein D1Y85_05410 [Paraburkholderia dinghuensis]
MNSHPTPPLDPELAKRIKLVRRDVSDLLFHFTRGLEPRWVEIQGRKINMGETASHVLEKILRSGELHGTSHWTYGKDTVCFTEAPIHEFNSVFALASIASEETQRPRYEPYGVAVSKNWLYQQGGRPVIYDLPESLDQYPDALRHRFCPYDPVNSVDFTWEREWRVPSSALKLDPNQTLVVVPTSAEAFEFVYQHASEEADIDASGSAFGIYHQPKWLAVSLDMFGVRYSPDDA